MITSTSNARVKELIQLQKKARERTAQDVFVAEGPKMVREVPPDARVQTCVSESFYRNNQAHFDGDDQVLILADHVFESISDTRTPQGVLCVVRQTHYRLTDLFGQDQRKTFLLILEDLQDPGNLGTMVRTAEAAGVTGILLGPTCADMYNPKTVRSTMGAIYRVPFFSSKDFAEDLRTVKQKGLRLFAAHLDGSRSYDREDYTGPTGLLIGNESHGLTDESAAFADARIRIPMQGQVESLNAAAAAAVLMYEVSRQRRIAVEKNRERK